MTDDQILAAAKRIKEKRAAAKKKGVRTKQQVQALARERSQEIERRCVDGDETMAHVARSMGLSSALVATRCSRIRRQRRRQMAQPEALSGAERMAIYSDLSMRALSVIRSCELNGKDYMKLTMLEVVRIPGAGRKTANEIMAFQKRSEEFRDFQLGRSHHTQEDQA